MFTGNDTGVTSAAQQAIDTVIAKAYGETCNVWAASIAIGPISTAVAELETNSPTIAVTTNTTASIAIGPSGPNAATSSFAIRSVAPVLVNAVASGSVPAISTTVFQ